MSNIQETLKMLEGRLEKASSGTFAKGDTWRTDSPSADPTKGHKFYNLDNVVQQLYPVEVPLLKMIPRVKANGGNAFNFKQVTAVNPSFIFSGGVEGQRGARIDHTYRDKTIVFKKSILEDSVTWELEQASQNLDPMARALASQGLINAFIMDEHRNVIGANGSLSLGTTATPVGEAVEDASSSLAAGSLVAIAVALNYDATLAAMRLGQVQLDYVVTNSMGQTTTVVGGHAIKSAASAAVTVAAGEALALSVAHTRGAAGYAWFVGATAGAARFVGATWGNTITVKALDGAAQQASAVPATDKSANPLRWDGLITQMSEAGSGSIIQSIGGDLLTPNGSGGIVEIDELLQQAYSEFKLSYTHLLVPPKLRRSINAAILGAPAGSGAARLVLKGDNSGLTTGTFVTEYVNPVTGKLLQLVTVPDLPDNCVLFFSEKVEYAVPNSRNIIEMQMLTDYYQVDFPMIHMSYDFGVATYGALAVRYPPAFGLLTNIGGVAL